MIPPKTFRLIIFATNIAWYSGGVPYRFVKKPKGNYELVASLTNPREIFVKTSFALNVFYIIFITFRTLQKIMSEAEVTVDFLVQMGYLFLCYTMTVVLQLNTLMYWKEIPSFFYQYLKFFEYVKQGYILAGERGPRCIKFFTSMLVIGMLVNLQNVIIILKKPERPHFLTSLLTDPKKQSILKRFPFLFLQAWIWISTWAHVWAFCYHLYAYTACMLWTLRELDVKVAEPKTSATFRDPKVFTKTLRTMHVLHRIWQHGHQKWFCPSHKAVAVSVGTLASYGVIKLSGPRSLIMGCMAALALLYLWTLFKKFGQLHEISETVLENWQNSLNSSKWMRKFVSSVPIFRIDIGSFYYVDKTTVVSVMWTVLNNTITLLFL